MNEHRLRYAQCWEDAACLLEGLDPRPGAVVLSIASGGENSLALLLRPGVRVIAIDRSPPQIACLELKVAAFRRLTHPELLLLLGAHAGSVGRRRHLYGRCRADLSPAARAFWEADPAWLACGVLPVGRFERYLALFRRLVLPLVHGSQRRAALLTPRSPAERGHWYDSCWDGWRWRLLFRLFFSRTALGNLGTDPSFVRFGRDSQADQLLAQVRRVMVEVDPVANPHLHWILRGRYGDALPLALRPESFAVIRSRLDQLSWHQQALEDWLDAEDPGRGTPRRAPASMASTSAMCSSMWRSRWRGSCWIGCIGGRCRVPDWCSGTGWRSVAPPWPPRGVGGNWGTWRHRCTAGIRCPSIGGWWWRRPCQRRLRRCH